MRPRRPDDFRQVACAGVPPSPAEDCPGRLPGIRPRGLPRERAHARKARTRRAARAGASGHPPAATPSGAKALAPPARPGPAVPSRAVPGRPRAAASLRLTAAWRGQSPRGSAYGARATAPSWPSVSRDPFPSSPHYAPPGAFTRAGVHLNGAPKPGVRRYPRQRPSPRRQSIPAPAGHRARVGPGRWPPRPSPSCVRAGPARTWLTDMAGTLGLVRGGRRMRFGTSASR